MRTIYIPQSFYLDLKEALPKKYQCLLKGAVMYDPSFDKPDGFRESITCSGFMYGPHGPIGTKVKVEVVDDQVFYRSQEGLRDKQRIKKLEAENNELKDFQNSVKKIKGFLDEC